MTATLQPDSSAPHRLTHPPWTRSAVRKPTALVLVFERGSVSTLVVVGSTLNQLLAAIEAASQCTAEPDYWEEGGLELCLWRRSFSYAKNLTLEDLRCRRSSGHLAIESCFLFESDSRCDIGAAFFSASSSLYWAMTSNNVLRASRSVRVASSSDSQEGDGRPPNAPVVTFARRTPSGRYVSYSRDDLDSDFGSRDFDKEYMNYHVHIPPTPDNQPMDTVISAKVEEQYVSNSLFTGGCNSVTRAHLMDKVIESEANHPQMAGAKGSSCAMPGCDSKVMSDERGVDILPCECDFKICAECFSDAVKVGGGICPGCKEPYKTTELEEVVNNAVAGQPLSLPAPHGVSKMERRLSIMRSQKMTRSQTGDWDHNRWLFETKGTYGYGNAIWPTEDRGDGGDGGNEQPTELMNKPWRPLTRKLKIPAAVLSPYR
ncbi:hypothetical protein BHE74_00010425 [Ensete ventricosum]|nr:hypothetical protein BHE74_00010425 [Ensete ventricosum]